MNTLLRISLCVFLAGLMSAAVSAVTEKPSSAPAESSDQVASESPAAGNSSFENPFQDAGDQGSVEPAAASSAPNSPGADSAEKQYGRTGTNPMESYPAAKGRRVASKQAPFWYPLVLLQRFLNETLSTRMRELRDNFSYGSLAIIFLISLTYGLMHAAGPGHGKVIMGSYFIASDVRRQKRDAVVSGIIVSVTQMLMAFILSLILYYFIQSISQGLGQREVREVSRRIGGIFVIVTGLLLMLITIFRKKIPFLNSQEAENKESKYSMYILAILAGIVPCPTSWIILVFSISFNIYLFGIIAILGMALGEALTIAATGYFIILGRKKAVKLFSGGHIINIAYWLRFAAGILLLFIGTGMTLPSPK